MNVTRERSDTAGGFDSVAAARLDRLGYTIIHGALVPDALKLLCEEYERFNGMTDESLQARGEMGRQGHRNHIFNRHHLGLRLAEFVFGPLTEEVCRRTLGGEAFLFWEQFVVKFPGDDWVLPWHQDSPRPRPDGPQHDGPWIVCWCALDDITAESGSVRVLPFDRAGTRQKLREFAELGVDEPGTPLLLHAGDMAVWWSTLFHTSEGNHGDQPRRAFLMQFCRTPIRLADGSPVGMSLPFIRGGRRVPRATGTGSVSRL